MTTPVGAQTITGRDSVIDGDTIEIRGQRIRLHAVDASESSQTCVDAGGRSYRCGPQAALALAEEIGQRDQSCRQTDVDRYRRIIAICYRHGVDLNGWMVREGHVIAYRRFWQDYVRDEDQTRRERRGMWAGWFAALSSLPSLACRYAFGILNHASGIP